jgi:DNA-binding transcriptional ArsR family regulator/uncharacterized protein YndB with AHSA1/START domain
VRDIQKVLAALASPVRREILGLIWDRELTAGEIAAAFPVTKPTISQHLAVLRESGLAAATAVGTSRRYRARQDALRGLHAALGNPGKWINADDSPERASAEVRTKPVVVASTVVATGQAATFAAFTDPAIYSRWLGVPVSISGGRFATTLEWGTSVRGRYELVCPPELIVMRWDFDDDNVPVPGGEMTGYLRIRPHDGGALVEVHQIVENAAQAEFMEKAWALVLGRLKAGVVPASDLSSPMPPRSARSKRGVQGGRPPGQTGQRDPASLPAAGAPLAEVGALDAERGVISVPGVDPGRVGERGEQALGHVGEQRGEVRGRVGFAHPAGEQRVSGEHVRTVRQRAARVVQDRDAAWRVPAQVDEGYRHVTEPQHVAVLGPAGDRDGQVVRVSRVRDYLRAGVLGHLGQRLPVIAVPVRGHDHAHRRLADHLDQAARLVGRVDQDALAGAHAAQQVRVVVHRSHGYLGHDQAVDLARVRRAADTYLSGVGHL